MSKLGFIYKKDFNKYLLFIIYPFGVFLYSLFNIKSKSSQNIFFLFCILFGYTFVIENREADSWNYLQDFYVDSKIDFTQYTKIVNEYIGFDSNVKDLYTLTCNFVISRFTLNYHFLMLLFASVFAFFYIKSFKYLTNTNIQISTIPFYLLAFIFTFSNPIFNINGVRFWTAAWLGVFSMLKIYVDKDNRYYFLAIVTPLIHVSYLIYVLVIIAAKISAKIPKLMIIIYIFSFFFSYISFEIIEKYKSFLPAVLQNIIWSYTESETAINRMNNINEYSLPLYATILNSLPKLFINTCVIVFIKERDKITNNDTSSKIFGLILLWMTLLNLTSGIPSMGRFIYLVIPIISYLWAKNYIYLNKYNLILYTIPLVFGYQILYWIKNMISISDPILYLSTSLHILIKNML